MTSLAIVAIHTAANEPPKVRQVMNTVHRNVGFGCKWMVEGAAATFESMYLAKYHPFTSGANKKYIIQAEAITQACPCLIG